MKPAAFEIHFDVVHIVLHEPREPEYCHYRQHRRAHSSVDGCLVSFFNNYSKFIRLPFENLINTNARDNNRTVPDLCSACS